MDNMMQLQGGSIHAGRQRLDGDGSDVDRAPASPARWPQAMLHGCGVIQSRRAAWRKRQPTAPDEASRS